MYVNGDGKGVLSQSVAALSGVGKVKAAAYAKLHIETLGDLLHHYPRAYENRGDVRTLRNAREDGKSAVVMTVATEPRLARLRKGMSVLKFRAYDVNAAPDDTGATCEITFFNQDYLKSSFPPGATFRFWGKVERQGRGYTMSSPTFEPWYEDEPLPGLLPVYRLTEGLTQKQVAQNIQSVLQFTGGEIEDPCPEDVRVPRNLCTLSYALRQIHSPDGYEELAVAKRRLIFDELFMLALGAGQARVKAEKGTAPACRETGVDELKSILPYALTGAQTRTIKEIFDDMAHDVPMSRMIVGDVGCGKTVCAAAAIVCAVRSGYQAALMVPTEILARQHAADLTPLLEKLGISVGLLVGAGTPAQKRAIYESLSSTDPEKRLDVVIGTQALLSEGVRFASPGLVITDEQHRFGVAQRAALSEKNRHAHLLVMSATPIPRTLALVLYGDLSISRIDEMPPGRQKVDTFVVDESYRDRLNGFIRKQVEAGGQVYVVCPAVEERETAPEEIELDRIGYEYPDADDRPPLKAAVTYADELRAALPDLSIAFVHGKMKSREKDAVMTDFAAGKIQVLVSTTVIEVGVNVPNACLMVVENAERFGLSQLHQLRGRVGRGKRKSWCILVSDAKNSEGARARLETMHTTYDGYAIAEQDLAQRGPGDFLALGDGPVRQSGSVDLQLADLCHDTDLLASAFEGARALLDADPTLAGYPLLAAATREFFRDTAGMMN